MGNLLNNIELPEVKVRVQLTTEDLINLGLTVIVAGTMLMVIHRILYNR